MQLIKEPEGLKVIVRWQGLPHSENPIKPLSTVGEDLPQMVLNLLQRKDIPTDWLRKHVGI